MEQDPAALRDSNAALVNAAYGLAPEEVALMLANRPAAHAARPGRRASQAHVGFKHGLTIWYPEENRPFRELSYDYKK